LATVIGVTTVDMLNALLKDFDRGKLTACLMMGAALSIPFYGLLPLILIALAAVGVEKFIAKYAPCP
jgi:hypothetical protein